MKTRENKGITLIALVITIIVLLILAGISIVSLTSEGGILNKANLARENQIRAEMQEIIKVKILELQTEKQGKAKLEDITQEWIEKDVADDYRIEIKENGSLYGKKIRIEKENIVESYIINEKLQLVTEEIELVEKIGLEKVSNYGREVTLRVNATIKEDNGVEKYYIYKDGELVYEGNENTKKIDKLNFNTNYTFKAKVLDKNGNMVETEDLSVTTNLNDIVYYNGKYTLIDGFKDFNTSSAATDHRWGYNRERTFKGITFYHLYAVNVNISNLTYSGVNTKQKIDLSNVNCIEFDLKLLNNYSASSNYATQVYYGIADSETEDYTNYVKWETVTSTQCNTTEGDCGKNGENKNVQLDVSGYDGEYYIKIVVIHPAIYAYNYEATINKITLKQ